MNNGKRILITGGCGFIGSNFISYLLKEIPDIGDILNLDKMTYSGKGENLEHMGLNKSPKYNFKEGDICDSDLVQKIFSAFKPNLVFNFAAESHVDRGIETRTPFVMTNIVGTHNLLEASVKNEIDLFFQISTDEVYGSLSKNDMASSETDAKYPRSTYSATKSAAEDLTIAAFETHQLPIIISRSSNNYGPYQYPEKLVPLFITNLIDGKKVPLMWNEENPGLNVRDWLHVQDNCRAIWFLSQKGLPGEIYNIPGENERTNLEITKMLLDYFEYDETMIEKVPHRKGHDFRYSIDGTKLRELDFTYAYPNLEENLKETIEWYENNENWWRKAND